jgi:hypothetical protein
MRRVMRLSVPILAMLAVTPQAEAQVMGEQCRATCAAMPRDDRVALLACLRRCGVQVQTPAGGRLTAGSGYGRRTTLPLAPSPAATIPAPRRRPGA